MQLTVSKRSIVEQQLEEALRLYFNGSFIPAITLAGAAEEILGKLVTAAGRPNALATVQADTSMMKEHLAGLPADPKWVADRANRARNSLKHLGEAAESTITFEPEQEAIDILERATRNYWRLYTLQTPAMEKFLEGLRGRP